MDDNLKKLDEIICRTGANYGEAYEALQQNDGDVIQAIVSIEKLQQPKSCFGLQQMMEKSKDTKIQIMKDEQKLGEIPAAAGALGIIATCLLPRFAIVGAVSSIAAMLSNVNLEITHSQCCGGKKVPQNDEALVRKMADLAEQNSSAN